MAEPGQSTTLGHIIVICLLGLLRKLNETESPKTVPLLRIFQRTHQCQSFMEQKKEFMKSKQAGWDRVKIRSTIYLFCSKIAGFLENSYNKCALVTNQLHLDCQFKALMCRRLFLHKSAVN